MKVSINGETRDVDAVKSVAQLAERLGLEPHSVLIEHNGVALRQREWPARELADGDRVEFIRVVAGG